MGDVGTAIFGNNILRIYYVLGFRTGMKEGLINLLYKDFFSEIIF